MAAERPLLKNDMTPTELKKFVSEKYNLVCFEDLAQFYSSNGAIFKLLQSLKKEAYKDNDKLVFYTSQVLDQEFLNHIQRALSFIDIGNFFVLIISPYDLTEMLTFANNKHGHDEYRIHSQCLPLANTYDFGTAGFAKDTSTLCPLPFMELDVIGALYPGYVKHCCKFEGGIVKKNTNDTLITMFNDDKIKAVRTKMLDGEKPYECRVCWEAEDKGQESYRLMSMGKFRKELNFDYIDNPTIKVLQLIPTNTCNFSCRICSYNTSSKIAAEEFRFGNEDAKKYINLKKSNGAFPLDEIMASVGSIDFLHILGGEPFKWDGLVPLLKELVRTGDAERIALELNTNTSEYDLEVIELLTQFKTVELLLSVDAVGDRFEIERGGSWDVSYKNIKLFASHAFNVKLATTINIQNLLYLNDIVELAQELKIDILWWFLENPSELSIDRITRRTKELVIEAYNDHAIPELKQLSERVLKTKPVSGTRFLDYMSTLDSRRNQKFSKSHREIWDAMHDS